MKRFLTLVLFALLALTPGVRADGPDDQYVVIYNLIQQGDTFNEQGQLMAAKGKYSEALATLKKFQASYPDWNVKVVRYRLNYLAAKVAQIALNPPAPAPAVPAPNPPAQASPAVPAPATEATPSPPAAVQPETPVPPAAAPPSESLSAASEIQIKALQDQVRSSEAQKNVLQAKLMEALSAQPAAVDPRELAKAEARVQELQKENELLKVSLAQARTNSNPADLAALAQARQELADSNHKVAQLTQANAALAAEKDSLLARVKTLSAPDDAAAALRAENEILKKEVADLKSKPAAVASKSDLNRRLLEAQSQIAALQSDKEILHLEKVALENRVRRLASMPATNRPVAVAVAPPPVPTPMPTPAPVSEAVSEERIKKLEAQRDELQKNLDLAMKELQGRSQSKETAQRIEDLTGQLGALRARIEVFEARQVPYTPEELALFHMPSNSLVASMHSSARRSNRDLPPTTAKLVAEAQRDIDAGELDKAEQTFIEMLKTDDHDVVLLGKLAAIQVELDHGDEAEKHLHQALAIQPDDASCLAVLGQLKFRQKKYDDALDALGRAAQVSPQDPVIQNFLGLTLSEKGLRGPAETALRKAIQIDPTYASAHNNLAVIYITQKPPLVELARWHYQKALTAGHPRNFQLEKLLDAPGASTAKQ